MIKGFFDSILDFLGLRQRVSNQGFESDNLRNLAETKFPRGLVKPLVSQGAQIGKRGRREPKIKEAVEKKALLPPVPAIIPRGQARVFVKKEFAKTKILHKKPIVVRKPVAARKLSARALQFEIEQILREAQALKKRLKLGIKGKELKVLRAKAKALKGKGKKTIKFKGKTYSIEEIIGKRQIIEKPRPKDFLRKSIGRAKFEHLTPEEVQELRKQLRQEKKLSDFDIERLKWNLKQVPEKTIEERELRTLELEKIRKSLEGQKAREQTEKPIQSKPASVQEIFVDQAGKATVRHEETIEEQIETTEELLKALERDFLKRRLSEQEYRQRVLDLNQKLRELKIRKKIQDEKLGKLQEAFPKVQQPEIQQKQALPKLQQAAAQEKPIPQTMQKQAVPQALKQQSQAVRPLIQQQEQRPSVQQAAPVSKEMQSFLEDRVGKSDEGKLVQVERNVQKLMKRFNLSESEAQQEILKIDKAKLLENFDKLVDLIELEQKTQRLMQENLELERERKRSLEEKPEFGTGFESGMPEKKMEEVKAIVLEIQKQRIITDFDNLLEIVQRKGKISASEALKELKISKNRLSECLKVLEQNNLVRVDFPPIGSEIIYDINYASQQKKQDNLKKK